jgi:hypothetical protein
MIASTMYICTSFYYMDMSVLPGNIPLVELVEITSRDLGWHIFHILTSEDIDDVTLNHLSMLNELQTAKMASSGDKKKPFISIS